MRKALVIPKAAACVVFLIVAIILVAPVMPVMSAKLFGGGTLDFNSAVSKDCSANRPVEGEVCYVLGADAGSSSDGAVTMGDYYYLVTLGGKVADNKNKIDTLILVKAKNGSKIYEGLNNIYRGSSKGNVAEGFKISGVLKKSTSDEKSLANTMKTDSVYADFNLSDFTLDLTKSVSAINTRFIISLIFFALTAGSAVLLVQAINKNASIEEIEDKRMAFKMEQDKKSGNKNDDGSDKMFGDSEANYGVKPPKDGESAPSGGYKPSFQSQGGGSDNDAPRKPTTYDESEDNGGFFGGGASQNGNFFGGSSNQTNQNNNQNDYYGGNSNQNSQGGYYGGNSNQNGQGGYYGGNSNQNSQNDYYGGQQYYGNSTQSDDDDYGFFGGH